ncbi:hypothetical protein [Brevibacterium litoralis]|uniref:hypothetical protein n=1 Tax=Brevibacterium litoralis TaxID=3138935 RepID=UPI0032EAEDC4
MTEQHTPRDENDTTHRADEPIEPTRVFDATRRSTRDRLRDAAESVTGRGTSAASKATGAFAGLKDFAEQAVKDGSQRLREGSKKVPGDPAGKAEEYASTAQERTSGLRDRARSQAGRIAAPGGAVDWTENTVNKLLGGVGGFVTGVVTSGKVDKAVNFAQSGVTKGATQARKLLRK